ncbi:hypothetical protein ACJRO7_019100 [Eucalyptus globulus]|uniref:Cyanobacterial aminoacyl-tRNA synthetase CAAD domain-containing protein n=1 Tax=Eucalyptus globulus TaxID=34317 RepID=A0ABD3KEJ0_EUCGL
MASTSTASSSSALSTLVVDGKAPRQAQPQKSQTLLTSLPPPPALHSPPLSSASAYCRKIARNVAAMATGEAPAEVAAAELPEIFKSAKEAWDKVEDKYAVSSLAVAGVVALWGSTGMISAIDRLPLIPGALELVGIGYTGVNDISGKLYLGKSRTYMVRLLEAAEMVVAGKRCGILCFCNWNVQSTCRHQQP